MKPSLLLLSLAVAAALCASAVHATDLQAIAGHEKKPHADTVLLTTPLAKPAQQQVLAKMHRIRDLLLATPALHDLRGYDWETFDTLKNDHRAAFPVVGSVTYIPFPYFELRGKVESSLEGPPFVVHLNDPEVVLGANGYNVDKDAGFTVAPPVVGELDGWPVYAGQFVVITKDRRPLFVPVTQSEYLDVVAGNARRELAEMKKRFAGTPENPAVNKRDIDSRLTAIRSARAENEQRWSVMQPKWPDRVAAERARFDEKERKWLAEVEELKTTTPRQRYLKPFEERLAALEAEIASLPEAERSAPARFRDGKAVRASGLASAGEPSSRPISRLNPQVFDAAKPKQGVQLIVLGTTRYLPAVFGQVQKQLDKQALVALLD
jgi:hypothetical protein